MTQDKQHRVIIASLDVRLQRADARALERAENEGWHTPPAPTGVASTHAIMSASTVTVSLWRPA